MTKGIRSGNLPEITPPSKWSLGNAISLALGDDWTGAVDNSSTARALRNAFLGDEVSGPKLRRRRQEVLVRTLIFALEERTTDGWRLELKGKRGRPANPSQDDEALKIGQFMATEIEAGATNKDAEFNTAKKFQCKRSKVRMCYRLHKERDRELMAGVSNLLRATEEKIEQMRYARQRSIK